jgi:hypothetical protein
VHRRESAIPDPVVSLVIVFLSMPRNPSRFSTVPIMFDDDSGIAPLFDHV